MIWNFDCEPRFGKGENLVFQWDDVNGVVSGPSAEDVMQQIKWAKKEEGCDLHPHGCWHTLSDDPLKSRVDMAALIGYWYMLPEELEKYYPEYVPDEELLERERQGLAIIG